MIYRLFIDQELKDHLSTLAHMRKLYTDSRYAYVPADTAHEDTSYYAKSHDVRMVAAFDNETLVGIMMGLPLKDYCFPKYNLTSQDLFGHLSVPINDCFYIAEILIVPEYRTLDVASGMYQRMEQTIKASTSYPHICSLVIAQGPEGGTRVHRPGSSSGVELDDLEREYLTKHGFKRTNESVVFEYDTLQEDGLVGLAAHHLELWIKNIARAHAA